jgi:mono/diheme cytochrome c family protein
MTIDHDPATAASVPVAEGAPSDPLALERNAAEEYLGKREGLLTALSVAALATLVLSFVGFIRAGHVESPFGGILPAELAQAGSTVYGTNCASCHGATGGGGVGPAMSAGAVAATFPNPLDQVRWVMLGSAGGADVYTAAGKQVKGGMPTWAGQLSLTDVVHAVLYERQEISGQQLTADVEQWASLGDLIGEFPDLALTQAEVDALIAEIQAAAPAAAG